MDLNNVVNRHFQDTNDKFYQNSRYCNNRADTQILILDSGKLGAADTAWKDSNATLHEPLRIDSLSDIYLDNFTTYDANQNATSSIMDNSHFILSINEFNIKTNSTNSKHYNKIIIPNEDDTGTNKMKSHKSRKMNYISTINPQTLTKLTGTITNNGSPVAAAGGANFRFIAEFIIVSRDK